MNLVKKIDIHAHITRTLGPPSAKGTNHTLPHQLCEMYDKLGVEKGNLLPLVSPEITEMSTNQDVCEVVNKYPDRFSWFCNIDPRAYRNSRKEIFDYLLNYYKALGAKGVGEVTANLYFDDPRVYALFAACERNHMPVTFHIGSAAGDYGLIDDFGLPRLEQALKDFPNLQFLGHSQRFWSHISGDITAETFDGYPKGPVTEGGRVVELMRKYPNLNGDLSAGSGFNAISRDPEFGYAFLEEFQDRLFYGIDICCPENIESRMVKFAAYLDDAALNGKISEAAYLKISRENALKLLGE